MTRDAVRRTLEPATISESDGVRYLHLGTPWVQGAMRLAPAARAGARVRAAHDGLDAAAPEGAAAPGHAVQLGLGAGAITRYCHGMLRCARPRSS